jgi:hypothetical protein
VLEIFRLEIGQHPPENEFALQFGTSSVVNLEFWCREIPCDELNSPGQIAGIDVKFVPPVTGSQRPWALKVGKPATTVWRGSKLNFDAHVTQRYTSIQLAAPSLQSLVHGGFHMAVLATSLWRVRPGKTQEFLANAASAKKILERLGGRGRLVNQAVGTNAPAMIFIVESLDWKAYGDLQAKMQTDTEWQAFLAQAISNNANPAADLIGTGLSTDVPLG